MAKKSPKITNSNTHRLTFPISRFSGGNGQIGLTPSGLPQPFILPGKFKA